MKNLIYYIAAIGSIFIILYMCEPVKPPVKTIVSGVITNPIGDAVKVFNRSHTFTSNLNSKGEFSIRMYLDSSDYFDFHHGREVTKMYIHPGDDIGVTLDTELFDETVEYANSELSSFLSKKFLIEEHIGDSLLTASFRAVSYDDFIGFWDTLEEQLLIEWGNLSDEHFINLEKKEFEKSRDYWYEDRKAFDALPKKGDPAIDFTYPDIFGDNVSLSDFKGKYVYVDVWATWCGPCRYEIPYLVELEKKYHDNNIVFLSVSVDSEKNKQVWLDMLESENMGGVQLFASGWDAQIMSDYSIRGIPTFMLFDPDGNVFNLSAPRPSSEAIKTLFEEIL